jgi:carbon storage regulator CsrA
MALVLTIKENGSLHLETFEGEIIIHVVEVRHRRVRIAVDAPQAVNILRGELKEQPLVPRDV